MKKIALMLLLTSINSIYTMQEKQPDVVIIMPSDSSDQEPNYTRMSPNFWADLPPYQPQSNHLTIIQCCYLGYAGAVIAFYLYDLINYPNPNL